MRPNPAGIRFVVPAVDGGRRELWLVCKAQLGDAVPLALEVDLADAVVAASSQLDSIVTSVLAAAQARGLELLEDPRLQLDDADHLRQGDPVVQRAIAAAHAAGHGTYRQLATQFGLDGAEAARDAIRDGLLILEAEPSTGPSGAERTARFGRALVGDPAVRPSSIQQRKFAEFQQLPNRDAIIDLICGYVELVGLDLSDLGTTWGTTVCSAPEALARVNVGIRVTLNVERNKPAAVYGLGPPPDLGRIDHLSLGPGFRAIDGSFRLDFPLDDLGALALPGLREPARAFVDSQMRSGINTNIHNPLMTPVIAAGLGR